MRKAGIALTILGVSAFAALLVMGLGFGTAQAQDGTATATATATAEATATPEGTATPSPCAPEIPTTFAGVVTLNGTPAPDGTVVDALDSDGLLWGTDTTSGGRYVIDVPDHLPPAPPCFPGGTISFTANDVACSETGEATSNPQLDFNLTCGAAATPTVAPPTVTVTVTVVPTGTPVVPPVVGRGSAGEGGFLWWPLALAAAALTAVAGLYTARRATR